jgi:hypothetical protein
VHLALADLRRILARRVPAKSNGVLEDNQMSKNDSKGQIARCVRFDIGAGSNEQSHKLFRYEVLPALKKEVGFKVSDAGWTP